MNPLTLAVSKVIINNNGSATGFFYKSGGDIFFITNKHVVVNKDGYNSLIIYPNFTKSNGMIISGGKFNIPAEGISNITYHHSNNRVDIAALWIIGTNGFAKNITDAITNVNIQSICCINDMEQVDISAEVADNAFIIGYPHGHNAEKGISHGSPKPIWKCGTIATEMSLNYDADNCGSFLIDATGQQGNSGSPVVAYAGMGNGMFKTANGSIVMQAGGGLIYKILGVMSAILINPGTEPHEKSDLCLVWKKHLIDEILDVARNT